MHDLFPSEITALLRALTNHQRLLDSITPASLEELAAIETEYAPTLVPDPAGSSTWLHEFLYPLLDFLRELDAAASSDDASR